MKRTNNYNDINSISLTTLEKYINSCLLHDDSLILNLKDIDFDKYTNINVFLKNIKTLELFNCIYQIRKNNIIIDLVNLKYLCMDYEYSIILILESLNSHHIVYPKFNNTVKENSIIFPSNNDNIRWFLRILENGKFRLSTIYLFTNINSNLNNKISL